MANQAKILLFNVNNDRQLSIEKLCRSLSASVSVSAIRPSMYMQSMWYLAGIMGFEKKNTSYTGSDFDSEMLVFSGIYQTLMDEFLESMKKAGVFPVALKAIITPTNIFWTPKQLYDELCQEHRAFHC